MYKIPTDKIGREDETIHQVKHRIIKENNYESILKEIESNKQLCIEFLFNTEQYIYGDIVGVGMK